MRSKNFFLQDLVNCFLITSVKYIIAGEINLFFVDSRKCAEPLEEESRKFVEERCTRFDLKTKDSF